MSAVGAGLLSYTLFSLLQWRKKRWDGMEWMSKRAGMAREIEMGMEIGLRKKKKANSWVIVDNEFATGTLFFVG